jgi:hypothetical protein
MLVVVTGGVLLADLAMLALVFRSRHEPIDRAPIGHAFEPVMQALVPLAKARSQLALAREACPRPPPGSAEAS